MSNDSADICTGRVHSIRKGAAAYIYDGTSNGTTTVASFAAVSRIGGWTLLEDVKDRYIHHVAPVDNAGDDKSACGWLGGNHQ